VRGCFLHIAKRDACVERGGDEGVPLCMRPDFLRQPGAASDPADDPPGAMPVQPPPVSGQEERARLCAVH